MRLTGRSQVEYEEILDSYRRIGAAGSSRSASVLKACWSKGSRADSTLGMFRDAPILVVPQNARSACNIGTQPVRPAVYGVNAPL